MKNIYSQKQLWKRVLMVVALVIVGVSLWYTNTLVNKIAKVERDKVKLWAQEIRNNAELVRVTGELFEQLQHEEKNKAQLILDATAVSARLEDADCLNYLVNVITSNKTLPVILVDDTGRIVTSRNVDCCPPGVDSIQNLYNQVDSMGNKHEPLVVNYHQDFKNYLYYNDSRIFSRLKEVLTDLQESFITEVVLNSASVPVIFTNQDQTEVIDYGNVDSVIIHTPELLAAELESMREDHLPILVDLGKGETKYIFYSDSFLLTQLKYYPIFQLVIIALFMLVAYLLFSTARRVEQNQVWVGMAKETAHQLGTPLSSLIAWMELLKANDIDEATAVEIDKDLNRLLTITERFSKIGSLPKLEPHNVVDVLENALGYMEARVSNKVKFSVRAKEPNLEAQLNISLFEWVIENLSKNAVDAMGGAGSITAEVFRGKTGIVIDLTDTGKGIPQGKLKTVFEPGYTTKKRGWGLGLSLTKRIIENYHSGKIYVKRSEVNKGTTFRIVLNQ